MGLTSKLIVSVVTDLTNPLALNTPRSELNLTKSILLASGTGTGQADKVWHSQRTLAASGTEDLDLAGVQLDVFGVAITFAKIKGLVVSAAAGNANNVVLGAAAVNPWTALLGATGTLVVRPGATIGLAAGAADAAGYAVVATTADLLKVANSAGGTGVTYDIVLIGTSV